MTGGAPEVAGCWMPLLLFGAGALLIAVALVWLIVALVKALS